MAGRTPAQKASIEKKALAAENKSDGMRQLFDAGYDVKTVRDLFGVPYGFAYGVFIRNGGTATPRAAKPKAAAKTTTKAAPKATATATAKAPRAAKSTAKATTAKSKTKAAAAK